MVDNFVEAVERVERICAYVSVYVYVCVYMHICMMYVYVLVSEYLNITNLIMD